MFTINEPNIMKIFKYQQYFVLLIEYEFCMTTSRNSNYSNDCHI